MLRVRLDHKAIRKITSAFLDLKVLLFKKDLNRVPSVSYWRVRYIEVLSGVLDHEVNGFYPAVRKGNVEVLL